MNEPLKLVEKKLHWKQVLANSLYRIYEETTGRKLKVPYGMAIGLISRCSESVPSEENKYYGWAWIDDDGVIQMEIPSVEDFEAQYRAFLKNEFAKTTNYSLPLFFKQFGNYETVKEIPLKVKPPSNVTRVMIHCSSCGKNHYSDMDCQ